MGSLSGMKSLVSKEYMPGERTATAGGLALMGGSAAALAGSRNLPYRTRAAWGPVDAAYQRSVQAMAGKPTKKQRTVHALVSRDKAIADRLVAAAPSRQKMLRSRGRAGMVAGAGLSSYGVLAAVNNRRGQA